MLSEGSWPEHQAGKLIFFFQSVEHLQTGEVDLCWRWGWQEICDSQAHPPRVCRLQACGRKEALLEVARCRWAQGHGGG